MGEITVSDDEAGELEGDLLSSTRASGQIAGSNDSNESTAVVDAIDVDQVSVSLTKSRILAGLKNSKYQVFMFFLLQF